MLFLYLIHIQLFASLHAKVVEHVLHLVSVIAMIGTRDIDVNMVSWLI